MRACQTGPAGVQGTNPPAFPVNSSRQSRVRQIWAYVLIACLAFGAGFGVAHIHFGNSGIAEMRDAVEECGPATGISFDEEGGSISFDVKGEDEASGASIGDVACLLKQFEVPDRIVSHMDQTTSLDGRQTETWGQYEVQWSYHPSRGMDGVIVLQK